MSVNSDNVKKQINENSIELIKHTAAVHVSNSLTLTERKVFNILLKNAFINPIENYNHVISIKQLFKSLEWFETNNYNELKKAIKSLNATQIEWNIFKKDKKNIWGVTTMLSGAEIVGGIVHYRYDLALFKMLINPNIYAKLNMIIQNKFRSKYSLIIWEFLTEILCSNKQNIIITDFIKLADFRKILGLEKNILYQNFQKFNDKILKKSKNEINILSDINIDIIFQRERRKITALAFNISKKTLQREDTKLLYENLDKIKSSIEIDDNSNLITILQNEFSLSKETSKNLVKDFSIDRINKAIEYVRNMISKDCKIYNISSYLIKAVKESWIDNTLTTNNKLTIEKAKYKIDNMEEDIADSRWYAVWSELRTVIPVLEFFHWISKLKFITIENKKAELYVNNQFVKDYIIEKYYNILYDTWKNHDNTIDKIQIHIRKEI